MRVVKHKKKIIVCSVSIIIGLALAHYSDEFRTSKKGLEVIGNAEGCSRNPYECPADVLTVGIGSTEAGGEKIERNRIYTELEIAQRWKKDIQIAEQCVNRYANGEQLPQGVFDAAVSLTFNVGCGAVKRSTFFRYLNQGNYTQACNQLSRWIYSSGKKLRGLEIRREKERQLCLAH